MEGKRWRRWGRMRKGGEEGREDEGRRDIIT